MEISRIVFDPRRVVPLRAESTVVELGYGQPLGAELSVKYIFIKKFFRDASDHRSYTLLSYFARAAFNRPALHAVILHGKVSASRATFSHLIFFHDSRAFRPTHRPFSPRRTKHLTTKIKKFVISTKLMICRTWQQSNREEVLGGSKGAQKKETGTNNVPRKSISMGVRVSWRRVFRNESVTWGKGKRVRRTSSSAIPMSVDH